VEIKEVIMETIFNYAPTDSEITECGFLSNWLSVRHGISFEQPLTQTGYLAKVTQEAAFFDLALLFEFRGDQTKADQYWQKIPERAQEYRLGFDYKQTPIE
jgi:hypothetical protein